MIEMDKGEKKGVEVPGMACALRHDRPRSGVHLPRSSVHIGSYCRVSFGNPLSGRTFSPSKRKWKRAELLSKDSYHREGSPLL